MPIEINPIADIEKLRNSVFHIGIQKDGVLTETSLSHVGWAFEATCPKYRKIDKILSIPIVTSLGIASVHFIRNLDLGPMVANGLLDAAIVGTDMIEENQLDNRIKQVRTLSDGSWGLHYMTARDNPIEISKANLVGTSYPNIARKVLLEVGNNQAEIWCVCGSTELLTLLKLGKNQIDGVIDISVSGKAAQANGLITVGKPYRQFRPVLIANHSSLVDESKKPFFQKL